MTMSMFSELVSELRGKTVERPNRADAGTLSGHAAVEPFEKLSYHILKEKFKQNIYKQYEYLNDLYLKNPRSISIADRHALLESPVALFFTRQGR